MERIKVIRKNKIGTLPITPGVYLFYSKIISNTKHLTPIYIGKAINIKDRIKNHFNQPSYRDNLFIDKVTKIGFAKTQSEIEALISEANLIKKYQPKFNVVWRDDKNYFYVAIAKNQIGIPYVYITHQPNNKFQILNFKFQIKYVGPFVDGNALKKTLKFLRRVFPFYTLSRHPNQKCTWCHLDLCPGPNSDLQEYKKNIKKLILILKGKRKNVLNSLKKEMREFSAKKNFEEASKIRDKIYALERVMAHARVIARSDLAMTQNNWEKTEKILQGILEIKHSISKIECYDVSNIQGKSATGSMVVFMNGKPDKSQYKKFGIRIVQPGSARDTQKRPYELLEEKPNDIAMLKQVLERRFSHKEWGYPEVILIDGGRGQLNVAIKSKIRNQNAKSNSNIKKIKILAIAKGRKELFIENKKRPIPLKNLPQEVYNLIIYLDDEAHRFALAYHQKLRRKTILS